MKLIIVPADLDKPMFEAEGKTYRDILKAHTDIDWIERVTTPWMHQHNFVMGVEDDGHALQREPNFRASVIARYPNPLVGDVVLLGETMSFGDGPIFASVPEGLMKLLEEWQVQDIASYFRGKI